METIIISFLFLILAPLFFGWLLIGVTPVAIALSGIFYLSNMVRRWLSFNSWKTEQSDNNMVLVVDDEYQSVIPLLKLLEQAKVPFHYVADGLDAIRELRKGRFRLVFMDISMPNLNGFEALKKADELINDKNALTPVVFYSGVEFDSNKSTFYPFKHLSIIDTWNKSMNLFRLHNRLSNLLANTNN